MKIAVAAAPAIVAFLGTLIGHGWIGHGLYKLLLFGIPFFYGAKMAWPNRRNICEAVISGLALGTLAFGLLYLVLPLLVDVASVREGFDARYHYTPTTAIIAAILIMSINALLEEWFYRGFLDNYAGVPLSVFFFGLQHAIVLAGIAGPVPGVIAGVAVMPAGLLWTWLARRSNGIFTPFISHALTDVILLTGGLWMLGYI